MSVPDPAPLAIPVLRETITLNGPAGQYTFAATLEKGGAASGGRMIFHVSDPATLPHLEGSALLWGIDDSSEAWLAARGLHCQPLTPDASGALVLIGKPGSPETDPEGWVELVGRLTWGATLLFLSADPFRNSQAAMNWLPLQNKGRCFNFNDWLYHKECVAKRHRVFAGLQSPGIMDWDYYGPVIPHDMFEGLDMPDVTIAAAFATGHHSSPTGYACGLLMAAYRMGTGRLILSTPYILENLDSHPAADRLLLNLIQYAMPQQTEA